MDIEIEFCKQEQIRFVEEFAVKFLEEVFGIKNAFISDMTKLEDFISWGIEYSIGKDTEKPGHYFFKLYYCKGFDDENKKEVIVSRKAIHRRKWLIRRCKNLYGVDISEYINEPLPLVLKNIIQNMDNKNRT
ncbi:MAG: hypothetical protein H7A25_26080 [Leptospiraceae bacterium]|nr:hypothetical protein [Leptospiraceae bacterium]